MTTAFNARRMRGPCVNYLVWRGKQTIWMLFLDVSLPSLTHALTAVIQHHPGAVAVVAEQTLQGMWHTVSGVQPGHVQTHGQATVPGFVVRLQHISVQDDGYIYTGAIVIIFVILEDPPQGTVVAGSEVKARKVGSVRSLVRMHVTVPLGVGIHGTPTTGTHSRVPPYLNARTIWVRAVSTLLVTHQLSKVV